MPEIGVERLAAGHDEHDRSHHRQDCVQVALAEEIEGMDRVESLEDLRCLNDLQESEDTDGHEPDDHDRSEHCSDFGRTLVLEGEQDGEDDQRDRDDIRIERCRHDFHSFDGAEHGDGGGDHAIAVEQARGEQQGPSQEAVFAALAAS